MNNTAIYRVESSLRRERGAALVVALVFLLVMTVLGVTSMRTTTLQERMAGNLQDKNLAFQAAEAALREGEEFLQQATLPPFAGANGLLGSSPYRSTCATGPGWPCSRAS